MTAWHLNQALTNFRTAVNVRWPGRSRLSDGTIGDEAHQATHSDHNPDADGSVDAWDMTAAGVDVELLIQAFESHESSGYWIHNRTIATRAHRWAREPYNGSNPHTLHVHWNTRPAFENSGEPWSIPFRTPPTGTQPGARELRVTSPFMTGRDVTYVQEFIGAARCGRADGVYGPATAAGVRWYQQMRGIPVTGIVNATTWGNMGAIH